MVIRKDSVCIAACLIVFSVRSMALLSLYPITNITPRFIMPLMLLYFAWQLWTSGGFSVHSKLVILMYLVLGISTIFGAKDYVSYLSYAMQAVGVTLLCEYYCKKDIMHFLSVSRIIFSLFVIANVCMQILVPGGVFSGEGTQYYFLIGNRIGFTAPYILTIFILLLYDFLTFGRYQISKFTIFISVLCVCSLLSESVSTGIVAIVLLFGLVFVSQFGQLRNIINYWILLGIAITLTVLIVVFSRSEFLAPVLEWLGEDLTFSNRTYIWATAISYIIQKPILGNGVDGSGSFPIVYASGYTGDSRPAHNNYLHILYEGGIVELSVFAFIVVSLGRKVSRCQDSLIKALITTVVFVVCIISITEIQVQRVWIFVTLAIASNVVDYLNQENQINMEDEQVE